QNRVDDIRKREMEARGISTSSLRDSTVLGVVAFLQRLERAQNNGRKRSKAFLDFLTRMYGSMAPSEEAAVEPPAPQIIL
ncbi:MAG TPA: hypothetical protein VHB50_00100, partial [Bryobacteraceae bacterium]|nr:hypothetical protein [Bryobacteraceae bacterium]